MYCQKYLLRKSQGREVRKRPVFFSSSPWSWAYIDLVTCFIYSIYNKSEYTNFYIFRIYVLQANIEFTDRPCASARLCFKLPLLRFPTTNLI